MPALGLHREAIAWCACLCLGIVFDITLVSTICIGAYYAAVFMHIEQYGVIPYGHPIIYLLILLDLMDIWVISSLGILWIVL